MSATYEDGAKSSSTRPNEDSMPSASRSTSQNQSPIVRRDVRTAGPPRSLTAPTIRSALTAKIVVSKGRSRRSRSGKTWVCAELVRRSTDVEIGNPAASAASTTPCARLRQCRARTRSSRRRSLQVADAPRESVPEACRLSRSAARREGAARGDVRRFGTNRRTRQRRCRSRAGTPPGGPARGTRARGGARGSAPACDQGDGPWHQSTNAGRPPGVAGEGGGGIPARSHLTQASLNKRRRSGVSSRPPSSAGRR